MINYKCHKDDKLKHIKFISIYDTLYKFITTTYKKYNCSEQLYRYQIDYKY